MTTRAEATELTRTGLRPLTPAYAAPEQLRGEPVSTATDVYALGVILFELLTARRPFASASSGFDRASLDAEPPRPSDVVIRRDRDDAASIDEIAHARGVTPRALAARLAGDLDAIVLKALRREPQRRYIGAGALAEDLDRFLQGRPVAARPEGRRYRAGKFVRRHRVGIAVAVSLVLSLVGGLAATAWQARAKTLEAQKAEAVKAFLISIFQGADPVQAAGRDITLRQVLDEGAGRVQRDLASQPAVQGELLTVLAGIYGELGITERAAPLTDQALAIHERLYGADSPLVATNLRQKASLALARGDADTADRFAREALERHRRAYGNLHQDVAEDLDELANAARQRGRLADALAAAEESLRIRKAIYGNEHSAGCRIAEQSGRPQKRAGSLRGIRCPVQPDDRPSAAPARSRTSPRRARGPQLCRASALSRRASAGRRLRTRSAGAIPPVLWRGPSVDADGAQQPRQLRSGAGSLRRGGSGIPIRPRLVGQNAGDGSSGRRGRAGQSGAHPSRTRRSGSSRADPPRCGRTLAPPNGRGAPNGRNHPQERSEAPWPTADSTTRPGVFCARHSIGCELRTARRTRRSPRRCTSWDNWRAGAATSPRLNRGSAKRSRCAASSWASGTT